MTCASGANHTITLSDDGIVYSFGHNSYGQLGLGHFDHVSVPTPIPKLLNIKKVSCGHGFTFCIDNEGSIWSFGKNTAGQLGKGGTISGFMPHKIHNIPPVLSVSCGFDHTLIITNDSTLWSCGNNEYGQLCLGNKEDQTIFKQTSYSDILNISLGSYHSLFQNYSGEIFACGCNTSGQLGLGHDNRQLTPILIPNVPSNIIQFVCGKFHNLFLDSEGNVFSSGENYYGQLGCDQNVNLKVKQIPNIPPIKIISCSNSSSYLIDFEGNLWSFGDNRFGQLGHDAIFCGTPTRIEDLKDIQQISYGCWGQHFLVKDSQNKIFVAGNNGYGQLGIDNNEHVSIPKEINPKYFKIWGREVLKSTAKSARK